MYAPGGSAVYKSRSFHGTKSNGGIYYFDVHVRAAGSARAQITDSRNLMWCSAKSDKTFYYSAWFHYTEGRMDAHDEIPERHVGELQSQVAGCS